MKPRSSAAARKDERAVDMKAAFSTSAPRPQTDAACAAVSCVGTPHPVPPTQGGRGRFFRSSLTLVSSSPSPPEGEGWGGGSSAQRFPDHEQHALGIGEHIVVPESNDAIAACFEPALARVAFF